MARTFFLRIATLGAMMIAAIGLTNLFSASMAPRMGKTIGGVRSPEKLPPAGPSHDIRSAIDSAIDFGTPYSALSPLNANEAVAIASQFDPADEYWGLARTPGVEAVTDYCGACHSLAVVMQQRQNLAGWDYLLTWMVEKQGMAPPDPQVRAQILSYLARELNDP